MIRACGYIVSALALLVLGCGPSGTDLIGTWRLDLNSIDFDIATEAEQAFEVQRDRAIDNLKTELSPVVYVFKENDVLEIRAEGTPISITVNWLLDGRKLLFSGTQPGHPIPETELISARKIIVPTPGRASTP